MRGFLAGLVTGVVALLLAGFLFVTQGGMPVATRGPPLPLERFLAGRALHTAVAKEEGRPSPLPADQPTLVAGAKVFGANCAVCHGLPGQPPSAIATGMYPPPPQLWAPGGGVSDDPVGETHWVVQNGIRLTGMPGFASSLSDEELWQVSLLLARANALPPAARQALR